jgi:hypothetical protein
VSSSAACARIVSAAGVGDPDRGQAERGLGGRDPAQLAHRVARVHREVVAGHDPAACDLGAADAHDVLVRVQPDVVADPHRWDDHAELGRDLAPDRPDARQQRATGLLVDERHEAEADRQLERVECERVQRGVAGRRELALGRLGGGRRGRAIASRDLLRVGHLPQRPADGEEHAADQQERHLGQRGDEREAADDRARDHRRLALVEDLPGDVAAQVLLGRRAGDEDAGRDRDQQRGDLRAQPVADRQQRELVRRLAERQALLHDADDDAADEVDQRDQDAGHRVALDELRGAVHRAIEVGLLGDLRAAAARLLVGDLARVEIGVDRHLLAGHGVEREARADFGDAAGAVRDDHELDDDEDQEDDQADDDVAADDEVAERGDHVPGVAVQQHEPGDRHVDRQPEQRGEQQEARERGEIQRARHVQRRHDDHQRRRDVQGDREVQQERRQRHDHHHDDQDDGARRHQVGVLAGGLHEAVHAADLPATR